MDTYFYTLEDDFFDFGDQDPGDYADSLDSPCDSTGSDIENHIIYDPNPNNLQPQFCDVGVPYNTYHHPHTGGKPPIKKVIQRRAANMRERRRMKCINDAFETLRCCIPNEVQSERRLSKVDTLRLAVRYISYLSNLLQSCNGHHHTVGASSQRGYRAQEKVFVRCQMTEQDSGLCDDDETLLGHSLSWHDPKGAELPPDSKLVAKIWMPESPTESDLINLATYSSDY